MSNIAYPSTVGRGATIDLSKSSGSLDYRDEYVTLQCGNFSELCNAWERPTVIISDGAYGILGFQGDTADHTAIAEWYEPHVAKWTEHALPSTTLWFWNSEIGWANVHPVLEKYGWKYVNANIWNKGKAHIAGNVNTSKIRRFPVVSEVCVQYVFDYKINGQTLQEWLISEWRRTGLPLKKANEACGVKDVAARKYLASDHLWYFPPANRFSMLAEYANLYGAPEGRPYFSRDGISPIAEEEWALMRAKFHCPHGYTNIWDRPPLSGKERVKAPAGTKAAHLNQKPLDLLELIIEASSDPGDVIWEPFGGLFSGCLAAKRLGRKAYGSEILPAYFDLGSQRLLNQPATLYQM